MNDWTRKSLPITSLNSLVSNKKVNQYEGQNCSQFENDDTVVLRIIEILDRKGPLTGKKLLEETKMDAFCLWKSCNNCEKIITKIVGRRYLRLDKQVEEYARLSPSIIREFYNYTVIGTEKDLQEILTKAELLHQNIKRISKYKFDLAQEVITRICESQPDPQVTKTNVCCIIAGDVVYEMAHLEPRPETSTGELVNGSDLDIEVITQDLSDTFVRNLDSSIYNQKNFLLRNPSHNEEIDYIIKDISKIKKQLQFDSFESMVASKIFYEGKFLYGSLDIFHKIKQMLSDEGIPEKIEALERKASIDRKNAEEYLLKYDDSLSEEENMKLFYTKEEKEEFF